MNLDIHQLRHLVSELTRVGIEKILIIPANYHEVTLAFLYIALQSGRR